MAELGVEDVGIRSGDEHLSGVGESTVMFLVRVWAEGQFLGCPVVRWLAEWGSHVSGSRYVQPQGPP